MTTTEKLSPAAQFFHDLAGEAYGFRRALVIKAYKDAVRTGKDGTYIWYSSANAQDPLRVYLAALLTTATPVPGRRWPLDTDDLIARLPFRDAEDSEINWDGFDDWLDHDGGWATFRDICLDWEPQWFLDFLEREGYIDKGV